MPWCLRGRLCVRRDCPARSRLVPHATSDILTDTSAGSSLSRPLNQSTPASQEKQRAGNGASQWSDSSSPAVASCCCVHRALEVLRGTHQTEHVPEGRYLQNPRQGIRTLVGALRFLLREVIVPGGSGCPAPNRIFFLAVKTCGGLKQVGVSALLYFT